MWLYFISAAIGGVGLALAAKDFQQGIGLGLIAFAIIIQWGHNPNFNK